MCRLVNEKDKQITSPLKSVTINQTVFVSVRTYFASKSELRFLLEISKRPIDYPKLKVATDLFLLKMVQLFYCSFVLYFSSISIVGFQLLPQSRQLSCFNQNIDRNVIVDIHMKLNF